jgi:hypothetical protein
MAMLFLKCFDALRQFISHSMIYFSLSCLTAERLKKQVSTETAGTR